MHHRVRFISLTSVLLLAACASSLEQAPTPKTPPQSPVETAAEVGTGLSGAYFSNLEFSGPTVTRLEPRIDFDWGSGAPAGGIGSDGFSARYSGELSAPSDGLYTFYATADDGVRLNVGAGRVLDDFSNHTARTSSGTVELRANGRVPISLEYFENEGRASLRLEWSGPGVTRQVIPTARLFAVAVPVPTTPPPPPVTPPVPATPPPAPTPPPPAPPAPTGKQLIELGWDSPTPDFVRANITRMEQRPFDGVVMRLNAGKTIFNKTAYPASAFAADRTDLSATKFSKFNHNFISIWAARETDWSWFDEADWAATATNASNFAKTAKAGGVKGFFFDPEPYGTNPWSYSPALYPTQSFAAVQAKVRQRGAAFLNAIQLEMPDVKILTLFGMTYLKKQLEGGKPLEQVEWALLGAFIDGMLDVIGEKAELIDGNEPAYYYYLPNAQEFENFKSVKNAARDVASPQNRAKYDAQVKTSQAIFVDGLLGTYNAQNANGLLGCHLRDANERQLTLEHHTYQALRTSDEYVWVYNEQMNWWGTPAPNLPLPDKLEAILARATAKHRAGQALGFGIEDFLALAAQRYARTWNGEPKLTCLP